MSVPEPTEVSYKQAVARLEEILGELDKGEVDIDALSRLVEEAAMLVQICRKKIKDAEVQVQRIAERLEREGVGPAEPEQPPS